MTASFLFLAIVGAVPAQEKPDFSGDWTLNVPASLIAAGIGDVQSGDLVIEHQEPDIRIRLTLMIDGRPFERRVDQQTDGVEVSDTVPAGPSVSSMTWEGTSLAYSSTTRRASCVGNVDVRYVLEDNGRQVRATETIRGCGRDSDNDWVFDAVSRTSR